MNSDGFVDTKHFETAMSIKRIKAGQASLVATQLKNDNTDKNSLVVPSKTNNGNINNIKCSIICNDTNKSFLGLKFSKMSNKSANSQSHVSMGADPDSDAFCESSVQATTHV